MLPNLFIQSLQFVEGFHEDSFLQVHQKGEQVTSVRMHPFKKPTTHQHWSILPTTNSINSNSSIQFSPVPWCSLGSYLSQRPSFTFDPVFHAGAYYVQEASSMYLWHVLSEIFGEKTNSLRVLDLCAAPGGKSTLLASFFKDGLIVSNEVIKQRAQILVENITKWGMDNVVVTNNDPSHFQQLANYFDVIVVDAPCSGSGMFRKDKQAIDEWSEENVKLCSLRQQRIINDVLPALKQGGILIYSTCSYSKQENEDCLDDFVEKHALNTISISNNLQWGIVETLSDKHKAFGYRFYPNKLQGEGFFIAAFQKNEENGTSYLTQQTLTKPSKQELQQILDFTQLHELYTVFKQHDLFKAMKHVWLTDLEILAKHLYIKKAGISLGTIKGKDTIPHHEWATSLIGLQHMPYCSVSKETALNYLRRKDVEISASTKGWNLIEYCGLFLGWVKVLPNRLNNYYPQEWRILKE